MLVSLLVSCTTNPVQKDPPVETIIEQIDKQHDEPIPELPKYEEPVAPPKENPYMILLPNGHLIASIGFDRNGFGYLFYYDGNKLGAFDPSSGLFFKVEDYDTKEPWYETWDN